MIINMPVSSDSTMVWDIQDDAIIDKEFLVDLPVTNTSYKVIDLNGEIHIICYANSKNCHYKWDGESWTQITSIPSTIRVIANYNTSNFCVYKNKIYATNNYSTDHGYEYVHIYDPSTNQWTTKANNRQSGLAFRGYFAIDEENDKLYRISQASSNSIYISEVGEDGTSTILKAESFSSSVYGTWLKDSVIYILTSTKDGGDSSHYSITNYYITNNRLLNPSAIFFTNPSIYDLIKIGNTRYVRYKSSSDCSVYKVTDNLMLKSNTLSTYVHNNEINSLIENYYVTTNQLFSYKLYNKKMTTYAPKGTKIYLPYEVSKPLTDNLEAIDGGYLVTDTGEVEIAVLE
jgi:hypothetical protein